MPFSPKPLRSFPILAAILATINWNAGGAWAACVGTNVNSNISTNTTWTLSGSPYCITSGNFNVNEGATLTINAGVAVKATASFTIFGTLSVAGTSGSRVTFDELSTGSGWGPLYFKRNDCTESHKKNSLSYLDITNLTSYLYLSQQSLTMDNVSVTQNTSSRYGMATYNNNGASCPDDTAQLTIRNSTVNLTSTAADAVSPAAWLIVDGTNTTLSGNTITTTFTGGAYNVYAFYYYTSNVDPFSVGMTGNNITVTATSDNTFYTGGVQYKEADVSGSVTGNTVTVTAPRYGYGIYAATDNAISGNTVSVTATPNGALGDGSSVYGIYSTAASSACNDLIINNQVTMTTAYYRDLYGIFFQSGNISGNRITVNHTGSNGAAYAAFHQYYSSCFDGNSVSGSATNATLYGFFAGTNYNAGNSITVKNNILSANGVAGSVGVRQDPGCLATVSDGYNLVYNFASSHSGVSAGTGNLYSDPLFANANLTLSTGSPAIDAGDPASSYSLEPAPNGGRRNMGAHGNTSLATTSATITTTETLHIPTIGEWGLLLLAGLLALVHFRRNLRILL